MCEPAAARTESKSGNLCERVTERHQARHLVGTHRCVAAGLRRILRLEGELAPAVELVEAEDQRQDDDRGRGLQVEALVQPPDANERIGEGPGQEHVARQRNAGCEKGSADS